MATNAGASLDQILTAIDPAEVISLTQDLVRIPSVTGQEGLRISTFMVDWLRSNDIDAGLQEVGPDRANVWGRVKGVAQGPRLLLNGHLDTKPGDNMVVDPLDPFVENGRMHGRGSCDMKGPVAGLMVAMKAIRQSGAPLRGTLIFGSEVGEEGGGWKIEELLNGRGACDLGICAEPTNLELHLGCRGGLPLTFRAIGVATHTGTAHRGVNAIQKMCRVVPEVYALECFQRTDPLWGRSPVNAMVIRGGGKVTASVPDECEVVWDIRLNPDLPPDEADAAIRVLLDRLQAEDPELKVEVKRGREMGGRAYRGQAAAHLPPDHPLVQAVSHAAESVLGRAPTLAGFPGGCSTGVMIRRGIPSVIFGPGNLEQAHSADEWVELDQLVQAAKVYAAIAYQVLVGA